MNIPKHKNEERKTNALDNTLKDTLEDQSKYINSARSRAHVII